jgi:hypothetical protein
VAFPQTIQDLKVEMYLSSTWTDITSKVRASEGVTIKRGRGDEANRVDPSSCLMTLDNRDGRFSPRNPNGIYYGQLTRNTAIRVSTALSTSYAQVVQETGTTVGTVNVSTPDAAALDIVGDLDIQFEADLESWVNTTQFVTKYGASPQKSYALVLTGGYLQLFWSADGSTDLNATATVQMPFFSGRHAVRATIDVNNGASGRTITFYTADDIDSTWKQLGEPKVQAGVTTIFNSTSVLAVGDRTNGNTVHGKWLKARVYNGIAGTLVANPDFTAQSEGATSFADSTGKTWTVNGGGTVVISKRDYRFYGEVSSFPTKWEKSGNDIWADIEAAGILRRLGQGQSPVQSTMRRTMSTTAATVAYWPWEDSDGAESIGSGLTGGTPMKIYGTPNFADNSDQVASLPLPTLNNVRAVAIIPKYTNTNVNIIRWYMSVPAAGDTTGQVLLRANTTGTISQWDLKYFTSGALTIIGYDSDGVQRYTDTASFGPNGNPLYMEIQLRQVGGNIAVEVYGLNYSLNSVGGYSNTAVGFTCGIITKVSVNPDQTMVSTVFGHLSVMNADSPDISASSLRSTLLAYNGETAVSRFERLCTENGIPRLDQGSLSSTPMGPQLSNTALALLQECAEADQGIIYEPRDFYGLTIRPRKGLISQNAVVTASYTGHQLSNLNPVDDDQNTINDITLSRKSGSSYRITKTTGPLNTASPPTGVGIYDDTVTVNLSTDDQLPDHAGWRIALGTVDEPRFPDTLFDLTSPSIATSSTLPNALARLDIGDRFVITNPPAWLPPEDIQQLAQGLTEYLANFERTIVVNGQPAAPWEVAEYASATVSGGGQYKYSSDGTTVRTVMTTSQTTMNLTTASGPLWTTEAAQFPIDLMVGGERMSATACSGSTASTQVFTVVRAVNGIVKTHAVGETVALFRPARYGL